MSPSSKELELAYRLKLEEARQLLRSAPLSSWITVTACIATVYALIVTGYVQPKIGTTTDPTGKVYSIHVVHPDTVEYRPETNDQPGRKDIISIVPNKYDLRGAWPPLLTRRGECDLAIKGESTLAPVLLPIVLSFLYYFADLVHREDSSRSLSFASTKLLLATANSIVCIMRIVFLIQIYTSCFTDESTATIDTVGLHKNYYVIFDIALFGTVGAFYFIQMILKVVIILPVLARSCASKDASTLSESLLM